jgi:hypothetical protein
MVYNINNCNKLAGNYACNIKGAIFLYSIGELN